jgi:hypothetical protein
MTSTCTTWGRDNRSVFGIFGFFGFAWRRLGLLKGLDSSVGTVVGIRLHRFSWISCQSASTSTFTPSDINQSSAIEAVCKVLRIGLTTVSSTSPVFGNSSFKRLECPLARRYTMAEMR